MKQPALFIFLVALTFHWATAPSARSDHSPPAVSDHAQKLLDEGDALVGQKDYPAALLKYKEAYMEIVPKLRGLEFKKDVAPKLFTRGKLQEHMKSLFAEEMSEEDTILMDRTFKVFGFAPAKMDVQQLMLDLYTESVAGFYNSENEDLVLVYDSADDKKGEKKGLLDSLFGEEESDFNIEDQKTTLAHELTHALQDQHHDLEALHGLAISDDDVDMAISSLCEGDATVLMFLEMDRLTGGDADLTALTPEQMDTMFNFMRLAMPFSGDAVRQAPPVMRESLIFPYHKGAVLTLLVMKDGGFAAVDKAFKRPPLSTEQILHPEKYIDSEKRDDPVNVEMHGLRQAAGQDWKHLGGNVLGEFQTGILLAGARGAKRAAAGWDGDRYEVFERRESKDQAGGLGLVWLTTWDSEKDAQEFAAACALRRDKHLKSTGVSVDSTPQESSTSKEGPSRDRLTAGEATYHIERRGSDVAVIEGFSTAATDELLKAAFARIISPKSYPTPEPFDAP